MKNICINSIKKMVKEKEVFSLPFNYKNQHSCEAVVLACIDFRFHKETARFIEDYLKIKSFDFPKLPGSVKSINEAKEEDDLAMLCLTVPCRLHHVNKIILINHSDCGAYGGLKKFNGDKEKEKAFHFKELRKAKKILSKKYSAKEIILIFAGLDKKDEKINFFIV